MLRCYHKVNDDLVESSDVDQPLWMRLTDPQTDEINNVAERWGLNPVKLCAALDADEPSQYETENNTTYLVVDVPYRTDGDLFDTSPMILAVNQEHVVSVSRYDDAVFKRFLQHQALPAFQNDSTSLAIRMLFAISREFQQNLKEIDTRRKTIETRIKENPENEDLLALHSLENSLVYFITSLKSWNMVLEQIKKGFLENTTKDNKELFKKVILENRQAIEMAEIYREILDSTRELASAVQNNKLNHSMRWLTAATIILTIPMIVTGAYGMNVELPAQTRTYAFAAIVVVTIGLCGIATLLLKKKKIF